jgi:Flp pilus assembly protein TadG
MTEMALLVPLLGLLFVGAVDFCRVFHLTQTLDDCAQNAALYAAGAAARNPNGFASAQDAATQAALDEGSRLSPPLTTGNVSVSITSSSATATVTYSFQTFTRIPGVPSSITLQRTVTIPLVPLEPGQNLSTAIGSGGNASGSPSGNIASGSGVTGTSGSGTSGSGASGTGLAGLTGLGGSGSGSSGSSGGSSNNGCRRGQCDSRNTNSGNRCDRGD